MTVRTDGSTAAPLSPRDLEAMRRLIAMTARHLEARKQTIDDLNVFPVPDGDTGTNLALTIHAVAEAVDAGEAETRPALAQLIKRASLMGARGNSGIILSQIVRGACEALGDERDIDAHALARAFRAASQVAYRAVRKPTEGTMLTVIREMAAFAERRAAERPDEPIDAFLEAVATEGDRSVERTPQLLAVLKEAGVVDSGGFGLVVILRGIVGGLRDEEPVAAPALASLPFDHGVIAAHEHELSEFRYCTNFMVEQRAGSSAIDPREVEDLLAALGDSIVVVGDETSVKVHIHTDQPGRALDIGTTRGVLGGVEVADMHAQELERTARLRAQANEIAAAPALAPAGGGRHLRALPDVTPRTAVVAVAVGDGNRSLFQSLGVRSIVEGGPSMNPSTADLLAAIEAVDGEEVILLPNDKNVVMAAEQAVREAGRPAALVESRSIPAGLAAMVAYQGEQDADENASAMRDALRGIRTGEVTRAVRSVPGGDIPVAEGQWIGLLDGEIAIAADEPAEVVRHLVDSLLDGDREVLTVLRGDDTSGLEIDALLEEIRDRHPDAEIDDHVGGQPLYPLLLAAE